MSRSAGSAKSKEQREVERRRRQVEKLPAPVALADIGYPGEKTVLSDQHFQRPVYENELDTPELFNLVPPDDFFITWSVRDCGRTQYPQVPEIDHRVLSPAVDVAEWEDHRRVAREYLQKHHIVPGMIPACPQTVNLTVVFDEADAGLTRRNFWRTAHCGNFVELKDLQRPPSVRLHSQADDTALYTLVIASPDYPNRVNPNPGFFLHWVSCNLSPESSSGAGDVQVPYVPPLPTEDAGTARILCMLFKQTGKVTSTAADVPFEVRSNFRLHDRTRRELSHVDEALEMNPVSITFLQTAWDIQVQEWYEKNGIEEPTYVPDDLDRITALNALPKEKFQISSRTLPDGTVNTDSKVLPNQYGETVHKRSPEVARLLSARTMLSRDRKPYTVRKTGH